MNIKHLMLTLFVAASAVVGKADNVYTIYPVTHSQKAMAGTVSFTNEVYIMADGGIDKTTIERAKGILADKGLKAIESKKVPVGFSVVYLGVNNAKGYADRMAKKLKVDRKVLTAKGKFDRHILVLTGDAKKRANVLILGENTDATFCGLASLEQMLDRGTKNLPCVRIDDYADIQYRGVIEGYYGVPYNADVTKDLFRFMARYKMNTYMYGAKSDPYHSQKWGEAYPKKITEQQKSIGYLSEDMMRDIVNVSHQNKVNFIWAIHPGKAFTDPKESAVIDKIMQKFELMYGLGVRQFGVFVDDVGVPSDAPTLKLNAERLTLVQQAVENRWNRHYSVPADTVKPINFVPQLYAYSWVKEDKRKNFFNALGNTPKHVVVYITGAAVWTVPNSKDLEIVSGELGRGLAWWWNYPCNDNDMTKLFVRDTYGNFADEKWIDNKATLPKELKGASALISNPMQQGAASKIALFGVGDYGWNNAGFDNEADFKAAVRAVVGQEKAPAFEYLTQYLRYYDNEPLASLVNDYKQTGDSHALKAEMTKLLEACSKIDVMEKSTCESDSIFYADIHPWMNKVSDMAYLTLQLLEQIDMQPSMRNAVVVKKLQKTVAEIEHNAHYQFNVLNGMGEEIELSSRTAEPAAKVLRPFLDYLAAKLN